MSQPNIDRDDIANKLGIVNKIIRKGYEIASSTVSTKYKEYCLSIKDHNYFQIREQLMLQLYNQLVS